MTNQDESLSFPGSWIPHVVYLLLILAAFCSSAGLPGSPLGLPGPPLGSLGLPVDKSSLCPGNSPPLLSHLMPPLRRQNLTFSITNMENRGPDTESEKKHEKREKRDSKGPSKTEVSIERGFKIHKIRSTENRIHFCTILATFLEAKVSTILLFGVLFFDVFSRSTK